MKEILMNQLIQYFYRGLLNFNLSYEDIETMTWDWQATFLNFTVKNELTKKYPTSPEFTRLFLKKIIYYLEPYTEVHDDFYTHLCIMLNESNSAFSYRHYIIQNDLNNVVTIKETRNMVVNGTTGLKTWEAALMLSDWALCNQDKFTNKDVLELGSGVGFTGITIGKLCGVKSLLLSDCHEDVVRTACENIKINLPELVQEETNHIILFKNPEKKLGVMLLDWNNTDHISNDIVPDIIIGADIVYDPSILQPLCNVFKIFSNRNKSLEMYIASVIRNDETFNSFLDILCSSGFIYEIICFPKSVSIAWNEDVKKCLLKINLRS